MARKPYRTDLTDKQWDELKPLIPPAKPGGRPRRVDMREVINGIRYVLQTGCAWEHLPHDLPPYQTCWWYFDRFSGDGTWRTIAEVLHPAAGCAAAATPSRRRRSSTPRASRRRKRGAGGQRRL